MTVSNFFTRMRPNQRSLRLVNQALNDNDVVQLAKTISSNTSLETLHLGMNKIGPIGAKALAQAITRHPSLRMVSLLSNRIGNEGAIALADAITDVTKLKLLDLRFNEISDEGAIALAKALQNSKSKVTVELSGNNISENALNRADETTKSNGQSPRFFRAQFVSRDGITSSTVRLQSKL